MAPHKLIIYNLPNDNKTLYNSITWKHHLIPNAPIHIFTDQNDSRKTEICLPTENVTHWDQDEDSDGEDGEFTGLKILLKRQLAVSKLEPDIVSCWKREGQSISKYINVIVIRNNQWRADWKFPAVHFFLSRTKASNINVVYLHQDWRDQFLNDEYLFDVDELYQFNEKTRTWNNTITFKRLEQQMPRNLLTNKEKNVVESLHERLVNQP
jgi:hypothetical protein